MQLDLEKERRLNEKLLIELKKAKYDIEQKSINQDSIVLEK